MSDARLQFTIRQLFAAIALLCVTLALATLEPRASVYIAAGAIGLGMLILAMFRRRRSLLVAGVFLLTVSSGLLMYHSRGKMTWVGRAKLPVHVLVIDTDTFEPVTDVIEVFNGPFTPLEGRVSAGLLSQFTPARGPGAGVLMTDARGECEFTHDFFAAGAEELFGSAGYIRTSGCWLKASSPGRGSVMLPMDGRPRNILDRSPLYIMMPLRKQSPTEQP